MMSLLDGRIDCDVTEQIESGDEYYDALNQLDCPSTLMGRVTMQMHYALSEPFIAEDKNSIGKELFYIAISAKGYMVAIDTMGKLRWAQNQFDGMPLLVITSEDCPKEYHETLTQQHISWIATGKDRIDLPRAMDLKLPKCSKYSTALDQNRQVQFLPALCNSFHKALRLSQYSSQELLCVRAPFDPNVAFSS